MRFYQLVFALICAFSINAYAQSITPNLEALAKQMEGNYNSLDQSKIDSTYLHIQLHMKRIWSDRTDAIWLYVEQASAKSPEKPYRQRVYRIREVGYNEFESEIMEFKEPLRFVGEWKKDSPLAALTADSVFSKGGCAVYLKKIGDNTYSGATDAKKCLSTWGKAKYATSIVTILKEGLISWDRGFNENDEYEWGAEKAGYFFKKEL